MSNGLWRMKLAMALAVVLFSAGLASAAPLGLVTEFPDINAANLIATMVSDGSGGFDFTATGSPDIYTYVDTTLTGHDVFSDSYSLSAHFDGSGSFTGGSISIVGAVPDYSILPGTTLFSGPLTTFGFNSTGGSTSSFEFLVDPLSGAPALGFGAHGGVILNLSNLLPAGWTFTTEFSGVGSSDNFTRSSVPEPTTLWLLGLAVLGVGARTRRPRSSARPRREV